MTREEFNAFAKRVYEEGVEGVEGYIVAQFSEIINDSLLVANESRAGRLKYILVALFLQNDYIPAMVTYALKAIREMSDDVKKFMSQFPVHISQKTLVRKK